MGEELKYMGTANVVRDMDFMAQIFDGENAKVYDLFEVSIRSSLNQSSQKFSWRFLWLDYRQLAREYVRSFVSCSCLLDLILL